MKWKILSFLAFLPDFLTGAILVYETDLQSKC